MMVVGDRDARLADRAAGAALEARRQGREGPDPVPQPAPARRAARTASGRRSSRRRSAIPAIAAPSPPAVLLAMALPVLHLHTAQSGLDALPNSAPTVADDQEDPERVPAAPPRRPMVAIKADIDSPATQQAIARAEGAGAREPGSMHGPDRRSTSTRRTPSPASTIPLAGKGTDAESNAALDTLRNDDPAGDDRHGRRRRATRSPATTADVGRRRTRC